MYQIFKMIFYLLIAVCFLFTLCKKEENRKEDKRLAPSYYVVLE